MCPRWYRRACDGFSSREGAVCDHFRGTFARAVAHRVPAPTIDLDENRLQVGSCAVPVGACEPVRERGRLGPQADGPALPTAALVPRQGCCASLRGGLRPPLTPEPLCGPDGRRSGTSATCRADARPHGGQVTASRCHPRERQETLQVVDTDTRLIDEVAPRRASSIASPQAEPRSNAASEPQGRQTTPASRWGVEYGLAGAAAGSAPR